MKTLTMRSMIAVAALAVAAVSASAQTYKADIPIAFRAANKVMAPGSYILRVVKNSDGHPIFSMRNVATHRAVFLATYLGSDAPKAWQKAGDPVLSFDCLGESCALRRLWTGANAFVYQFPGRKVPAADKERMASITVMLTKGD